MPVQYDELAELITRREDADSVFLMINGGRYGGGCSFSVRVVSDDPQADNKAEKRKLAGMLEFMAAHIRKEIGDTSVN